MKNIFAKAAVFLEMIKFEHSVFALPFAYLGLFFGVGGVPDFFLFFWVTVAMVSFRTMAMAMNRLLDRALDAENPRTQGRALPQKKIRVRSVWIATAVSLLVFEISAYLLGPLCFALSPVPVFLAGVYPFTKRFTWLSHFVLGLILGIAPYGAWIAATGKFGWAPMFLTIGVMCWVAGFDMIYALQDIDFDMKKGLFSFPSRFGIAATLKFTRLLHAASVFCWFAAGFLAGMGICYWVGLIVVTGFLIRENQLVRSFGVSKINEAFFLTNAVVSIVLFVSVVLDKIL
ncbi:MAG TPA: UbiA-like polyprenyltransferase [Candidatus Omnitrophota bacterium]|nr:UbiA-like polyprenyltransferase [Candidatus Omnitrophota bacterium]HRY85202.1 UbiA-like polyprenyltransferase [Candidatus Omnitrophota bacterium]